MIGCFGLVMVTSAFLYKMLAHAYDYYWLIAIGRTIDVVLFYGFVFESFYIFMRFLF